MLRLDHLSRAAFIYLVPVFPLHFVEVVYLCSREGEHGRSFSEEGTDPWPTVLFQLLR